MVFGAGAYGSVPYGARAPTESTPVGKVTKNTRQTSNIHPGVSLQTIIASQGI